MGVPRCRGVVIEGAGGRSASGTSYARVRQQMPVDGDDGVACRDDGAFLATSPGQAPVSLSQEGIGAGQAREAGRVGLRTPRCNRGV